MTWKSGGVLVLTAGLSIIGIKELVTENGEVVNNAPKEVQETNLLSNDFVGPNPEIIGSSGLGTEAGETWAPAPVSTGTEKYNWGLDEAKKAKNRAEAEKIYPVLNDYSFKIFGPCANGTGWILDYQIPEKGKYPTKWYIGTSSHVIWRYRFSEGNNTYKQLIPYGNTYYLRRTRKTDYESYSKGERIVKTGDNCDAGDKYGYFDMNIAQEKKGEKLGANRGAVAKGQMKEPKLFYAAFNFLDPSKVDVGKHFADFAVLEIEFTSEQAARDATNGFADKYKDGNHPINLLAQPLEEKYKSWFELQNSLDNFYLLAYPVEGKGEFEQTKNWDEETTIASRLGGLGSAKKLSSWGWQSPKFIWYGEEYKEIGHFYSFGHNPLGGGASGGLFVDGDGNALGVLVQGSYSSSWAQPLRSSGTTEAQHGVDTPAYDLISGVPGQLNSYKQQVQEYILKEGRKTWLSTKAGWEKDK